MSRAKGRAQYYRRTGRRVPSVDRRRDRSVDRSCDGFGMSLLVGGFQDGPWFQNTTALGAFGILAPRYDWFLASFTPPAPTHSPAQETSSSEEYEDFDQMAQALDRLIEEWPQRACRRPPIIEESSSSSDEEKECTGCAVPSSTRNRKGGLRHTAYSAYERTSGQYGLVADGLWHCSTVK